jgi:hypothetical protein
MLFEFSSPICYLSLFYLLYVYMPEYKETPYFSDEKTGKEVFLQNNAIWGTR